MCKWFNRLLSVIIIGLLIIGNFSLIYNRDSDVSAETPIIKNDNTKLVLYDSFDDNGWSDASNNNVKDDSGNNLPGKTNNHAKYTGNTLYGRAMRFDGHNDYVSIASDSKLTIDDDLTIEAWIFFEGSITDVDKTYTILNNQENYYLYIYTGHVCFLSRDGLGATSVKRITANNWTHVAVTRSGDGTDDGDVKIYLNGTLDASGKGNAPKNVNHITYLGCHDGVNGLENFFCGIIDELKIFNKVLTPSDGLGRCILKMGFEEDESGGDGTVVYDRSGYNFSGILDGPSWSDAGRYDGRCLDFDGSNDKVIIASTDPYLRIYNDMTIEAWIYWDGGSGTIIAQDNEFRLYISNSKLCFSSGNSGNSPYTSVIGQTSLTSTLWTKIGVTRAGNGQMANSVKLYINGKCDQTGSADATASSSESIYVGCGKYHVSGGTSVIGDYFSGRIDNVQIYNCVNNIGCDVLSYNFDENYVENWFVGDSSDAVDESPYGNDGDLCGHAVKYMSDSGYGFFEITKEAYKWGLHLDGTDDYLKVNQPQSLDITTSLTIEARVISDDVDQIQTIVGNRYHYNLYIDRLNAGTYGKVVFTSGGDSPTNVVVSSSTIPLVNYYHTWTYIAVTRDGDGTSDNSVKIYINGVLDAMGKVDAPTSTTSDTYLGCWNGNSKFFAGFLDNVAISNYVKTLHEDTDCDGMAEMYEMIRATGSNQYNPLEYNGRYAILCAPVRSNNDIQFKHDITQMRYYLLANGWSDCDIIFLTCENNLGRENVLHSDVAVHDNPGTMEIGWIDGEAYHNNLGNALNALDSGGAYQFQKAGTGNYNSFSFAKITDSDTVFIELRDHGDGSYEYCTYTNGDYDTGLNHNGDSAYYWSASNTNSELNNIEVKYLIMDLDMCYSGGWGPTVAADNRMIIMSQSDGQSGYGISHTNAYLFYSRIWGDINGQTSGVTVSYGDFFGKFVDASNFGQNGIITTDETNTNYDYSAPQNGNEETSNADGVLYIDGNRNCQRGGPTNAIISVQEAHYFADAVTYDRFGSSVQSGQTPQRSIGNKIPFQIYV
jgi:hypothetical protein